jgi:hypothetical protein
LVGLNFIFRTRNDVKATYSAAVLFFVARVVLFLSLSYEGLRGYTDYWDYFALARLGWPFFDYWVEYPPVFPFLFTLVYKVVGGREQAFVYVLALLLSAMQAVGVGLFIQLGQAFLTKEAVSRRVGWYAALLVGLFYGWGFFDALVVWALLAGLYGLVKRRNAEDLTGQPLGGDHKTVWATGLVLGVGGLLKWFPLLVLPAVWRYKPPRQAIQITGIAVGLVVLVYGALFLSSPDLTLASFRVQGIKGSWETVWALVDGHIQTGNMGVELDRTDPTALMSLTANPGRLSPFLTLIPFAGLGLWLFGRVRLNSVKSVLAFSGLTFSIFMLWLPGWSPQWSLYFLPLILLVLPERRATLMAIVWIGINLLEWPLLLSRGWFQALWLLISLRTFLLVLLAIEFWRSCEKNA